VLCAHAQAPAAGGHHGERRGRGCPAPDKVGPSRLQLTPLQGTAAPLGRNGGTSGKMYLIKGKMLHGSEE